MAKVTKKVGYRIELTKPDEDAIGAEATALAELFMRAGQRLTQITQPIRDGFDYNFQQEGVPGAKWKDLADWTAWERAQLMGQHGLPGQHIALVAGFSDRHPIQQRTGAYRKSWTQTGGDHGLLVEIAKATNTIHITEGSKHEHVDKLAGGGLSDSGMPVPARPVAVLADMFTDRIKAVLDAYAEEYAATVK